MKTFVVACVDSDGGVYWEATDLKTLEEVWEAYGTILRVFKISEEFKSQTTLMKVS
jgi:hypothetical protein